MISLKELAATLQPERTVLFLGAGASVPSGAPSGVQLAKLLETALANGESLSTDLMELSGMLERRYGRAAVIRVVREKLKGLVPAGGLLVLPEYRWASIYTTNYDTLVESAFSRCGKQLVPIRSNYDYGRIDTKDGVTLFKLHGCVTQDISDGHKGRMVLSEADYDAYLDFRQSLFKRMQVDLLTKDVLFLGHSLRDPHLRREVKEASDAQRSSGAPGHIYCLIYEKDNDRAALMEDRGIKVAFGGIDEFMNIVAEATSASSVAYSVSMTDTESPLPTALRASTHIISELRTREANVTSMFNGAPASYADIANGFTFERSVEDSLRRQLVSAASDKVCATIIGVGGVGKTTVARRIADRARRDGVLAWEHSPQFPLKAKPWLAVTRDLMSESKFGLLVVDNSPQFQSEVNALVDGLSEHPVSALRLLLIGERSAWLPRKKSPKVFSRGIVQNLYLLDAADIERMVSLLSHRDEIRRLIDPNFATLSVLAQVERLRRRCSADMFVSLKHVFGAEGLDTILLREYAELTPDLQDVYRTVAALEVSGTHVHRQLIIRLLGIQADTLRGMLNLLEGLVDEYDIKPADGLYGWRTRHEVIAATLSRYKYSEQDELWRLLHNVVEQINPAVWLERQTISQLCNADFGIKRLSARQRRLELYRALIAKAPGERVPRHRLISELLAADEIDEAEAEIRLALEAVGLDSPIHRSRTRATVRRAVRVQGLLVEDRVALLKEARRLAYEGVRRFPDDKYSYSVFEEIAWAHFELTNSVEYIDEAISMMRRGFDLILDPDLGDKLHRIEQRRLPISARPTPAPDPGGQTRG